MNADAEAAAHRLDLIEKEARELRSLGQQMQNRAHALMMAARSIETGQVVVA